MNTDLLRYTPPHSDEHERATLGALLIDNAAIDLVTPELVARDFYRTPHAIVFDAILELHRSGEPVDELTVTKALERTKRLEAVGGPGVVSALTSVVPSSANAVFYAKRVKSDAVLRAASLACAEGQREVHESSDPTEQVLERLEARIFEVTRRRVRSEPVGIDPLLAAAYARLTTKAGESRLRYGFHRLDELTHGLHPGQLVVVAGRPSMGKSTFAINLLRNLAATRGEPSVRAILFTLETTKEDVVDALVCSLARVDSHAWRGRNAYPLSREARQSLEDAMGYAEGFRGLYVDDEPGLSVLTLRAKARRLKAQHGLDAIIVDYLQLMTATPGNYKTARHEVVGEISRSLKALARELEVPLVALAQLNRNVEDRLGNRPKLADLRESGSIEQDADVVILLHRPAYYETDEDKREATKNEALAIVAKNRNGPTGDVPLFYQPQFALFSEPVR